MEVRIMKNCVIYAEVTSRVQTDKLDSITGQITTMKDFAQKNEYSIDEIFTDYTYCVQNSRPAFNYMLEKIKRGEIKTILCQNLGTIIAEYCDAEDIIGLLKFYKVKIINPI